MKTFKLHFDIKEPNGYSLVPTYVKASTLEAALRKIKKLMLPNYVVLVGILETPDVTVLE